MVFPAQLIPPKSVAITPVPSPSSHKYSCVTNYNRRIDNVIFDLGDVFFTWSANTNNSISPKTLKSILCSSTWFEYRKGNIEEEEAYRLVAAEFLLDVSEVGAAFRAAPDTFQSNTSMITLLHDLKHNRDIRLFAMSNISAPDWEFFYHKTRPEDWSLFDYVFTSAAAHEHKPNLGCFRQVLESTGIDPHRTAFVDDGLENVVSAISLGFQGIVFTSFDEIVRALKALVRDSVVDGERYLREHAKKMKSVTNTGVVLEENFAQLLILEVTGDPALVDYIKYPRSTNFFKSGGVLTTASYPCDLDATSIACTVCHHFKLCPEVKKSIMDEILTMKTKDGIVQTHADVKHRRIDPIVCVNVLTFFYANGRGEELQETFDWVFQVLKNRAYTNGTIHYHGPDAFLYFFSRLLLVSVYARRRIGNLFAKRVSELFGTEGDALALAMRIRAAAVVNLRDVRDYERLRKMQEADGSWPMGWLCKYDSDGILIGNKGMTTAFAVSAMRVYRELELGSPRVSKKWVNFARNANMKMLALCSSVAGNVRSVEWWKISVIQSPGLFALPGTPFVFVGHDHRLV